MIDTDEELVTTALPLLEEEEGMIAGLNTMSGDGWSPHHMCYWGPDSRSLFLGCEITQDIVAPMIGQLLELDNQSNDPITLWIMTNGGDLEAAFAIYDVLTTLQSPVITIGTGRVMSAGLLLLQAGDQRLATERTNFMHHMGITEGQIFSHQTAKNFVETYRWHNNAADKIIRGRSTMSTRTWNKYFREATGHFFRVPEALRWGLIDGIYAGTRQHVEE